MEHHGYSDGVVEVTKIYDNVGDVVKVIGVTSESYDAYNQLYRITHIGVGTATEITVSAASSISSDSLVGNITGVGATVCTDAYVYLTGESQIRLHMTFLVSLRLLQSIVMVFLLIIL